MISLEDKRIFISGAGAGMGYSVTRLAVAAGAEVCNGPSLKRFTTPSAGWCPNCSFGCYKSRRCSSLFFR